MIKQRSNPSDTFIIQGRCESDENVIASSFNGRFKSVFKDNGRLPEFGMSVPQMPNIKISEHGIQNLLLNLNVKTSSGPDAVPNAFFEAVRGTVL